MLKQFKSTSLADQVFDRLENDIIQGVYPKGEILTELKLVEQLGVSRTPIREALRRLEQERLIEDTGKGSRVLGITEEETLKKLKEAVKQITEKEQFARKSIQGEALDRLTDRILRSEGLLKHAFLMSSAEFIKLFADVRFGISLGIVEDISYEQLGTLLVDTMPATLTLSSESTPKNELARDKLRAQRIKLALHRTAKPE